MTEIDNYVLERQAHRPCSEAASADPGQRENYRKSSCLPSHVKVTYYNIGNCCCIIILAIIWKNWCKPISQSLLLPSGMPSFWKTFEVITEFESPHRKTITLNILIYIEAQLCQQFFRTKFKRQKKRRQVRE